jgi:hypothetical protein
MSDPHHIALRNALSQAINDWATSDPKTPEGMVILGALADVSAELIGQAPSDHRGMLLTAFVEGLAERLSLNVLAIHRVGDEPEAKPN